MRPSAAILLAIAAIVFSPRVASALDPFEIQVYDGTANAPGAPGLELHLNHVALGVREAEPPALAPHRQTHMTLEPSLGILPTWEIGGYFQTALRADGTFDYAGAKLRSKHVTPPGWHEHVRLGVNFELSLLPERYEPDRWGAEIRPIAAWSNKAFRFAFNPIVGVPLAGNGFRTGPTFEPALSAMVDIAEKVGVGLEYYGSFGPIASPAAWSAQQHYLFEVVELLAVKNFELNFGVGEGLTAGSNDLVFKMILGYEFDVFGRENKPTTTARRLLGRRL